MFCLGSRNDLHSLWGFERGKESARKCPLAINQKFFGEEYQLCDDPFALGGLSFRPRLFSRPPVFSSSGHLPPCGPRIIFHFHPVPCAKATWGTILGALCGRAAFEEMIKGERRAQLDACHERKRLFASTSPREMKKKVANFSSADFEREPYQS